MALEGTQTYCDFPSEHWSRIHTNNVIERLNREIRRRTRVVDGNPALMQVCVQLHYCGHYRVKYMDMKHIEVVP